MTYRLPITILVAIAAAACGGATQTPPASPSTTSAPVETAPAKPALATPPVDETPAPASEPEATTPAPERTVAAEPCDGMWTCVKVPLTGARKVEARPTQLIGDPAIESTSSGMTDDVRGPVKLDFDGKSYEVVLKRLPGDKSIVVLRGGGGAEVTLAKHDKNDFTHVGVIATKKDGALLVDVRYMK
jgi:hypothetical protein